MHRLLFPSQGFRLPALTAMFLIAANVAYAEEEIAVRSIVKSHIVILESTLVVASELQDDPNTMAITGCSPDCPPTAEVPKKVEPLIEDFNAEKYLRQQLDIASALINKHKESGIVLMLKSVKNNLAERLTVLYVSFIKDVLTDVRARFNDDKGIVEDYENYATGHGGDASAFRKKLEEAEAKIERRKNK